MQAQRADQKIRVFDVDPFTPELDFLSNSSREYISARSGPALARYVLFSAFGPVKRGQSGLARSVWFSAFGPV